MKVFFTASQRGKKFFDEQYKKIYALIEELGYKHLDNTIINISTPKFYDELEKEGIEGYKKLYNKNIKGLSDGDINIFECSLPSLSVGYMIQKSLDFNKPTVILYFKDNIPHFLSGIDNEKLVVVSYNEKNMKEVLQKTLVDAGHKMDKRFNFFISPELLTYLDEASKKMGITKSTFIRNLINEHRSRSKST